MTDANHPMISRRWKYVAWPVHTVHNILVDFTRKWPEYIHVPVPEFPLSDCTVLHVHYNAERRSFQFLVHHHSFDPVPEGELIPIWPEGNTEWFALQIRTESPRICDALRDEVLRLRRIFADFRADRQIADDAYRQGVAESIELVRQHLTSPQGNLYHLIDSLEQLLKTTPTQVRQEEPSPT